MANLLPLAIWKISQFFFKKLIFLPWKNPISERFDNSYFFMSIERQLCYLKWFLKNSRFCSEENASVFVLKKPKFERFEKSVAFNCQMAAYAYFENF